MPKCTKPTQYGRCRKCQACLETRQRAWLLRMLLEAQLYDPDQVTFLTLTYKPEALPSDVQQAKIQLQRWLKRLRKVVGGKFDVRYVAALEQGTKATKRYHWHAIIYGIRFTDINRHLLQRSWGNGFIDWKPASPGRMSYVLKYVIKGHKFLMSRRPGIGHGMLEYINATIDGLSLAEREKYQYNIDMGTFAVNQMWNKEQPPVKMKSLRIGKFFYPLHAYIKQRIKHIGDDHGTKKTQPFSWSTKRPRKSNRSKNDNGVSTEIPTTNSYYKPSSGVCHSSSSSEDTPGVQRTPTSKEENKK